ncbi:hypothetical protein [Pseudomonas sp. NPDC007930]|uniref:hypothetical protein n=1 Tax=Pseudomonas sp. NPDC007930 TaxID=3364417 RepID=UPI0036E747BA
MAFFTPTEQATLAIERMIIHVVGTPHFIPMPERPVQHADFFIRKILDTACEPLFGFKPGASARGDFEAIASGALSFERGAQSLAANFQRQHQGKATRDGVLCMFELSVRDAYTRIYSLIKYDYREAIEQDPANALRRIVTALVDDKKAVQKSALVRVVRGAAQSDVAARDRTRQAPDITDFFAAFLGVSRRVSDKELSAIAKAVLTKTLKQVAKYLPEQNVTEALRIGQGHLGRCQRVGPAAMVDAVLAAAGNPSDGKLRARLAKVAQRNVARSKLNALEFTPDKTVLRQPAMRQLVTVEGVRVYFRDGARVRLEDHERKIVIETAQIVVNGLAPGKTLRLD